MSSPTIRFVWVHVVIYSGLMCCTAVWNSSTSYWMRRLRNILTQFHSVLKKTENGLFQILWEKESRYNHVFFSFNSYDKKENMVCISAWQLSLSLLLQPASPMVGSRKTHFLKISTNDKNWRHRSHKNVLVLCTSLCFYKYQPSCYWNNLQVFFWLFYSTHVSILNGLFS